jgi:hypothetical protein
VHGAYLHFARAAGSATRTAATDGWPIGLSIVAVCLLAVGVILLLASAGSPDRRDDDEPGNEPRGGRGPNVPRPPGDGPAWWPEFERRFAAYAERARGAEPVLTVRRE